MLCLTEQALGSDSEMAYIPVEYLTGGTDACRESWQGVNVSRVRPCSEPGSRDGL